jgi:glycosyltransferase involved in cell wall biosynthesis
MTSNLAIGAPRVSVVIPTKNRLALLRETVDCLRNQTFQNWEAVIADDRSDDDTFNEMKRLAVVDPRIRPILRGGSRSGAQACRNQGLAAARGQYVIFLDSDDLLTLDCLENRVRFMDENPSLGFAAFATELFRERPGDRGEYGNTFTDEDDLDRFLKFDLPWQVHGPIWRREALRQVGRWDESALSRQDWEFHVRALAKGIHYRKVPRADSLYRSGTDPASVSAKDGSLERLRNHGRIYVNVHRTLLATGTLTKPRRIWLAGLFFTAARRCLWPSRSYRSALAIWTMAASAGTIGWARYLLGALILGIDFTPHGHLLVVHFIDRLGPGYKLPRSPTAFCAKSILPEPAPGK